MHFQCFAVACLAFAITARAEAQEKPEDDANKTKVYTPPQVDGLHWAETFDGDVWSRWTLSAKDKYNGKFKVEKRVKEALVGDVGLVVPEEARHYGASASFTPVEGKDGVPFIAQFEVQFQEGLSCGGSYIKIFDSAGKPSADFDNDTPYVIMFGPDKCGATNKVHFILKHKNPKTGEWEEKHLKNPPSLPADSMTHMYTLIINPDNSFDVQIDGESKATGNLLDSMEPPVNPPKEIDDPDDSKPKDWVDEAKINDPSSSKPDDWDEDAPFQIDDPSASMPTGWNEDAAKKIADPAAKRPDDWDDEEDGEWEAPMIDNPACKVGCGKWTPPKINNPEYKGKWYAPKIDNPEYKGEWKAKQIPNPNFFEDKKPCILPKIDSVGIDIWTMSKGMIFDNLVIATDVAKVKEFTASSFKIRNELEKLQAPPPPAGGDRLKELQQIVMSNPIAFAVTAVLVLMGTVWLCCLRSSDVPPPPSADQQKEHAEAKEDDKKDEAGKEKEEEEKEEETNEKEEKGDKDEDKPKVEEKKPKKVVEGGLGDLTSDD